MSATKSILVVLFFVATMLVGINSSVSAACNPRAGGGGLPIPTWYEYLPGKQDPTTKKCVPDTEGLGGTAVLLIMFAIFDIILFIVGFGAVIFIIYGGFKLLTSTGEPQKIAAARTTLLNALIGLVIALIAAQVVGFIAGRLT